MPKNNYTISDKVKASVLSALEFPGYNLTQIAKTHNISKTTIYTWLRERSCAIISNPDQTPIQNNKKQPLELQTPIIEASTLNPKNNINNNNTKFLELPIVDSENLSCDSKISKASLVFNDFSIVLEGQVPSKGLIAIIQILEKRSC